MFCQVLYLSLYGGINQRRLWVALLEILWQNINQWRLSFALSKGPSSSSSNHITISIIILVILMHQNSSTIFLDLGKCFECPGHPCSALSLPRSVLGFLLPFETEQQFKTEI